MRGQFRHVHRRPSERAFGHQPFKVPRAGFHAAPAHRPAFRRDPVGRTFLAVGFPDLIAVEHQLRPGGDRARRAFAGAFVAGLAKTLQPEIYGPVVGHRMSVVTTPDFRRGPRNGFRITSPMRLTSPRPESSKSGGCSTSPSHNCVRLGCIAEVSDLSGDHPAQQRKPQIGTHGLCDTDPIVAAGTLHRLVSLIDNHRNRLIMGWVNRIPRRIVRIPGPVRAAADANRVDAQPIRGRLDQIGVFGSVIGAHSFGVRIAVLQQHKGPSIRRCAIEGADLRTYIRPLPPTGRPVPCRRTGRGRTCPRAWARVARGVRR